jgi:hypothetical protein
LGVLGAPPGSGRGDSRPLMKATPELVTLINSSLPKDTNLILHVTC